MNCNYKVKITDIQNKYQFKILCKGGANSINVNDIYNLLPTTTTEGDAFSIANTSDIKAKSIAIKGNTTQDGTPTPTSPVDVINVSGINTIKIGNKNLIEDETFVQGSIGESGATKRISCRNIKLKANTTYTLSSNLDFSIFNVEISTSVNQYPTPSFVYDSGWKTSNITFTTGANDIFANIMVKKTGELTIVPNDVKSYHFQIEVGSTTTNYMAHQEKDYTINLGNIELCKISTYQDYLYKENNKWYLHKEIIKIILSKTKNWAYYSITSGSLFRCSNALGNDKGDNRYVPFCSHYQGLSFYDSGTSRPNNNIYINSVNHNLDLVDNRFTSVDDFKTWLGNNEVVLYYPLSTPTDTEVTDATLIYQLNKILNNARTFEGTTNIDTITDNEKPIISITTFNKLS